MPSAERALFLEKMNELRARLTTGSEYDLLVAAAIIRSLLLDAAPLVDVVNCELRNRITFRFRTIAHDPLDPDKPVEIFETIQDGIDPESSHRPDVFTEGRRDQFLKTDVIRVRRKVEKGDRLVWEEEGWTVRDVILAAANAEGGTHFDPKPSDKHSALRSFSSRLAVGGQRVSVRAVAGIARVVLRGLAGLEHAVRESMTPPDAS